MTRSLEAGPTASARAPRAWCIVPQRKARSRHELLRTQTLFRDLNEAVQVYFRTDGKTHGDFVCECTDSSCVEQVVLAPAEYADVRAHPTRFFVVPGHELSELDRIVGQNDRFMVVEKPVVP